MADKKKTPDRVNHSLTRRQFIHRAGAAAATITVAKNTAGKEISPNERIGVGFIGCGGRSNAHLKTVDY
ncbi:MAG: twin-arginine translocation signal domain-containing protein, partial [Sedimentisphaerales bacterium]